MTQVAKFVLLHLKPEKKAEFMKLIEANREHVKNEEPGSVFWTLHDVVGKPDSIAMYEIYEDQAASDEHDRSPALAPVLAALGDVLDGEPTIIPMTVDRHLDD